MMMMFNKLLYTLNCKSTVFKEFKLPRLVDKQNPRISSKRSITYWILERELVKNQIKRPQKGKHHSRKKNFYEAFAQKRKTLKLFPHQREKEKEKLKAFFFNFEDFFEFYSERKTKKPNVLPIKDFFWKSLKTMLNFIQ